MGFATQKVPNGLRKPYGHGAHTSFGMTLTFREKKITKNLKNRGHAKRRD